MKKSRNLSSLQSILATLTQKNSSSKQYVLLIRHYFFTCKKEDKLILLSDNFEDDEVDIQVISILCK